MNNSTTSFENQEQYSFSQIMEVIQNWLKDDVEYAELYTQISETLNTLLSENISRLQMLRNATTQDELLLRLLAEFLGFEWKGSSTLSSDVLSILCQVITSYYPRNGRGATVIYKPFVDDNNIVGDDFYDDSVFINVQTTARVISYLLNSSIIIQQLWTRNYSEFYTLHEVASVLGRPLEYDDTIYSTLQLTNVQYLGMYNAFNPHIMLQNGIGQEGDTYTCGVSGNVDFGDGLITCNVGDKISYIDGKWLAVTTGNWYLSPHVKIDIFQANPNLNYLNMMELFYYLCPITMVIEVIRQYFEGFGKQFFTTQLSTYKITFKSKTDLYPPLPPINGFGKQFFTTQLSTYKITFPT